MVWRRMVRVIFRLSGWLRRMAWFFAGTLSVVLSPFLAGLAGRGPVDHSERMCPCQYWSCSCGPLVRRMVVSYVQ